MASRVSTQVLWGGSSSKPLFLSDIEWSDPFLFDNDDWQAELVVRAQNTDTPVSGDKCEVYLAYTCGDIDGFSGDDFVTLDNAENIFLFDTVIANPSLGSVSLRPGAKGFRIGVIAPNAAVNGIVIKAIVSTHRS